MFSSPSVLPFPSFLQFSSSLTIMSVSLHSAMLLFLLHPHPPLSPYFSFFPLLLFPLLLSSPLIILPHLPSSFHFHGNRQSMKKAFSNHGNVCVCCLHGKCEWLARDRGALMDTMNERKEKREGAMPSPPSKAKQTKYAYLSF